MKNYDVIILGAGAAGLMCAITAAQRGRRVLLLEKGKKVGAKILISGGGRCNFTNIYTHPDAYLSQNPHFAKSALSRYQPSDFIALVEKHGLTYHEKTKGQLFCDQKSGPIVAMLVQECEQAGVEIQVNAEVLKVDSQDGFHVHTPHEIFASSHLVIATGGPSIPKMGASDFGTRVAQQFGLEVIPFSAGLVPLTFSRDDKDQFFQELSGIALDVEVGCKKTKFREAMLITHRGLSGPAILQISSYWQPGLSLHINLLPDQNAQEWLLEQQATFPQLELKTVLGEVLPKRWAKRLCETVFANKKMEYYGKKELGRISHVLNRWEVNPAGTEGMRTAEVALGGVATQELSSKTFEAHKVPGLYFIGETVDVTGHLGGYNFQWAWASGYCAGQYV